MKGCSWGRMASMKDWKDCSLVKKGYSSGLLDYSWVTKDCSSVKMDCSLVKKGYSWDSRGCILVMLGSRKARWESTMAMLVNSWG